MAQEMERTVVNKTSGSFQNRTKLRWKSQSLIIMVSYISKMYALWKNTQVFDSLAYKELRKEEKY